MNRKCVYLTEGECEEKLIAALKEEPALLMPGKVKKFNVIQEELKTSQLVTFTPGSMVVLVFDTDVDMTEHLKKNIDDRTQEEWEEYFKKEYDWVLKDLFESKKERIKSRSKLLVEALGKYWLEEYLPGKQAALSGILPKTHFDNLIEMFKKLFEEKLQMTTTISERIRRYVDGYRNTEEIFEMISDISTEMINRFVGTVGTDYYRDFNFKDLEGRVVSIDAFNTLYQFLMGTS